MYDFEEYLQKEIDEAKRLALLFPNKVANKKIHKGGNEKPLSLYPLEFDDVLKVMLNTPPIHIYICGYCGDKFKRQQDWVLHQYGCSKKKK